MAELMDEWMGDQRVDATVVQMVDVKAVLSAVLWVLLRVLWMEKQKAA